MGLLENHTVYTDNVHSPQLLAYNGGTTSHVLTATVICLLFQRLWTQRLDCLFEMVQRFLIFFFNICYLWIHRKRLQQSLLLPTQHTLLWELGFSWTQVSFPLSSSPDLSLPIQDIVSAVWVFYTLSSCVTPPGMTAHLFVYTNVSSMLNGFVDLSSFGNGAVLLDQHPLSYCLKTHPSWRLP